MFEFINLTDSFTSHLYLKSQIPVSTGPEYRNDRRCGSNFYAPNGEVAKCDPHGIYPCCSNYHYCGSSDAYCECGGCLDYRIQGKLYNILKDR